MCRLYGFVANQETKLECTLVQAQNSLMRQSQQDSLGRANADGWGISHYNALTPTVDKAGGSAADDPRFNQIATQVRSKAVIAHIRLATVGATDSRNAHPFRSGVWSFAHNGTVYGFSKLQEQLASETNSQLQQQRLGTTDSEQVFYWMLTRLLDAEISLESPLNSDEQSQTVLDTMAQSAQELMKRSQAVHDEAARLNFLLTDGNQMFATRWNNSLFVAQRDGVRDCQVCKLPHVQTKPDQNYRAVVIASEPISNEPWQEIENGSICHIDRQQRFRSMKIE